MRAAGWDRKKGGSSVGKNKTTSKLSITKGVR